MAGIDRDEAEAIAEKATCKTIERVFTLLGVDINDKQSVNAFRADLMHARRMRKMTERAAMAAVWGITVAVIGGVLALTWDGIVSRLK